MSPLPDETGGQEEKRVEEARQTRSSSCPLLENVCPSCRVCAFVRLFRNIRLTPEINPLERTAKK